MRGKVNVYVSKFSVKNESDGRYTIRDILMFWHDILKRTVQERKPSAWWMLHIMKQKRIKRLRPISDNFQTLLMVRKRDFTIRNSQNKLKHKNKKTNKTWKIGQLSILFSSLNDVTIHIYTRHLRCLSRE